MKNSFPLIKILFLYMSLLGTGKLFAQSEKPVKQWYSMSVTEIIFSKGQVNSDSINFDPTTRFSVFLHLQSQSHFNFSKHFGLYTGIGTRNVGLINDFKFLGEDAKIKQRSYSLGVSLALKLGNMATNKYIAIGAEGEWMFAYKRKIFYKGEKSVQKEWFSKDVNSLNPSLFAEFHFSKRNYIKFKYYMDDFLKDKTMSFIPPGSNIVQYYKPTSSKMYYISVGTTIIQKKKKHATKNEV